MRTMLAALLSVLGFAAPLPAQEDPVATLAQLERSYWDAQRVAGDALQEALDTDDEPAKQAQYDGVLDDYRERFADLAMKAADHVDGGDEVAVAAWTWVANLGWRGNQGAREAAREAVQHLLHHHLSSPSIGGLVHRLSYVDGAMDKASCCAALRRVIDETPHADIRREAQLSVVRILVGGEAVTTQARSEALEHLKELLAENENGPGADEARRWQFELENLQVGMVAPDFSATDQQGITFRLSDYRGKVVVLDWWAFWCGACMREKPELENLTAELAERPFAVIGINGDGGDGVAERVRLDGSRWCHAIDGGPRGPLSTLWNVRLWPTMVVIDREGVIVARAHSVAAIGSVVRGLLPTQ